MIICETRNVSIILKYARQSNFVDDLARYRKYCLFEDARHTHIHMVFGKCKRVIARLPNKHQLVKSRATRDDGAPAEWSDTRAACVCKAEGGGEIDEPVQPACVGHVMHKGQLDTQVYAKRVRRECISSVHWLEIYDDDVKNGATLIAIFLFRTV